MKTINYFLLILAIISNFANLAKAETRNSRLSAGVTILYSGSTVTPFLQSPA